MSIVGLDVEYSIGGGGSDPQLLERLSVAFERAGAEVQDFSTTIFPNLVPVFEAALKEQFGAEGQGPARGQWAELSQSYAAWKAVNFPGEPLLVAKGDLRDALTEADSPFALRDFDATSFNFGTSGVPYASYHQSGTGRMPARPPFDFDTAFERELSRAALEGVRETLNTTGVSEFAELSE